MAQVAVAWGRAHVVLQLPQLEGVLSGVSQPLVEMPSQLPQPAPGAQRQRSHERQAAVASARIRRVVGLCC